MTVDVAFSITITISRQVPINVTTNKDSFIYLINTCLRASVTSVCTCACMCVYACVHKFYKYSSCYSTELNKTVDLIFLNKTFLMKSGDYGLLLFNLENCEQA